MKSGEEFDENGDYVLTDDTLPDVKPSDLPKYWRGMFDKKEQDSLTREEHAAIKSETFDQDSWNAMHAWNKHKLDPEIKLNEPELLGNPHKPWAGVKYYKDFVGDIPLDSIETPEEKDPWSKATDNQPAEKDPKWYTAWKAKNFQAKEWFGAW